MVTSLTPVRRAICACVRGTSRSSDARYRAPAAIPTGEFASRIFESFPWATKLKARAPQQDRGPLPEGRGEPESRGQAGKLRQARRERPLRAIVAGPPAHPPQAVQGGHAPGVDGIPLRIPKAIPDHRAEPFVGRHHGRGRTRTDPVVPFERRPVGPLVHEALVDDESAVVAHAFPADRVHVEGEAPAVRASGGIPTFGRFLPLPRERHVAPFGRSKLTHCVTSRDPAAMAHRVAQTSRSPIASNRSCPFGDRRYSTATGRSRWTFRSAIPTSSSSFSVFARELWQIPVATRSSLNRLGPERRLCRTVNLSSEPITSKANIAPQPGPVQGVCSSAMVFRSRNPIVCARAINSFVSVPRFG